MPGWAAPRCPAASSPFRPEPVLAEAQYEQALAVLRNARSALERSPSMTASLDEKKIRDLLLVFLNAQFGGAARLHLHQPASWSARTKLGSLVRHQTAVDAIERAAQVVGQGPTAKMVWRAWISMIP
jgi:hypothetical protein